MGQIDRNARGPSPSRDWSGMRGKSSATRYGRGESNGRAKRAGAAPGTGPAPSERETTTPAGEAANPGFRKEAPSQEETGGPDRTTGIRGDAPPGQRSFRVSQVWRKGSPGQGGLQRCACRSSPEPTRPSGGRRTGTDRAALVSSAGRSAPKAGKPRARRCRRISPGESRTGDSGGRQQCRPPFCFGVRAMPD